MIRNIRVAEETDNLLCQDTGIPIYNVTIGRGVEVDGAALKDAIRKGCERATREHSLRSSVVHPDHAHERAHLLRPGRAADPHRFLRRAPSELVIEMVPKGSGSENNSWLRMAVPAEGVAAIKTFVDRLRARRRRQDLPAHHRRRGRRRHLGSVRGARQARRHAAAGHARARIRKARSSSASSPRRSTRWASGPQGLGGDSTAFAVHVEIAATHITMNPVAVNMQCHSARRASATFTPRGVAYGF